MNHLIEHIDGPIGSLEKCRFLLKRNAKLVVVTRNMEAVGSPSFKKVWFRSDPPRYIDLFSSRIELPRGVVFAHG
jgi:hypothetical protein